MAIGNHTLPSDILETCTEGFFYCFSKWAYDVTGGLFWMAILLGFSLTLMMATITVYGRTRAFGFASMTGLLGSIWLATAKLMPWWTATIFIIVGGIGVVSMLISDR